MLMMSPMLRTLSCGCKTCGCACPDHSGFRAYSPCARHAISAGLAFAGGEALRLAALALFVGAVAVWASILGS